MRALLKLIANDALLLWRTGYFLVSAIIIIFFAWGASRLSLPPVSAVADFIAALALFLTVMTPLLTVGIMLISERTEGVLTSMAVMPVGLWKSILSRTIVIASLTTVEMFVLFYAAFGAAIHIGPLVAGLLSITVLSVLCGIYAVAPYATLHEFILPMAGWVIFLALPAFLTLFGIAPHWFAWHPTAPAQRLVAGAFGAQGLAGSPLAAAGAVIWIGVAGFLAARGVGRMRQPAREG